MLTCAVFTCLLVYLFPVYKSLHSKSSRATTSISNEPLSKRSSSSSSPTSSRNSTRAFPSVLLSDRLVSDVLKANPRFFLDIEVYLDGSNVSSVSASTQTPLPLPHFDMYTEKPGNREVSQSAGVLKYYTNALVYDTGTFIFVKNTDICIAITRCYRNNTAPTVCAPPTSASSSPNQVLILERAIVLGSNIWRKDIYHAISEKVFPVALARRLLEEHDDMVILIDDLSDFVLGFFAAVGLTDRSRFIVLNSSGVNVFVRHVYIPTGSTCGTTPTGTVQAFQRWIREANPSFYTSRKGRRIVLLDRREGGMCTHCMSYSHVLYQALKDAYPDRRIHMILAGEMTVRKVMEILSEAEVFIAPHGAGLVNLMFLPPHGSVVEIHNRGERNACYRYLAVQAGYGYVGIDGLSIESYRRQIQIIFSKLYDLEVFPSGITTFYGIGRIIFSLFNDFYRRKKSSSAKSK